MTHLFVCIRNGKRPLAASYKRLATSACVVILCACFEAQASTANPELCLPAGTSIEVRLSTAAGSRISKPGQRVAAEIIAPVLADGRQALLENARVSGLVEDVQPLGLGLKHGIASIQLRFNSLKLSDGREFPIAAKVREVENARERVDENGSVQGILPTANLSSGLSFAISTLLLHTELTAPAALVKVVAARSPDADIYLPPGTELVLELDRALSIGLPEPTNETAPALAEDDRVRAEKILGTVAIQQTTTSGGRSSDLVNLLLLGTPAQLDGAFRHARWGGENRRGVIALYRIYHSLVERTGYSMAPMAQLRLNGVRASRTYQKSLDTLAKRHHVRLWNLPDSDAWLAAASQDIGFTVRNLHVTHAIDLAIDNERAKVVNDLWFAGCVEAGSLLQRESLRVAAHGRVPLITDGNVAVLRLRARCETDGSAPPQAAVRSRIAAAFRAAVMDIARANPLTVGLVSLRTVAEHKRKLASSSAPMNARSWRRAIVIEAPSAPDAQEVDASLKPKRDPAD